MSLISLLEKDLMLALSHHSTIFFKNPTVDTLILSSTEPYDNFVFNWVNTQNTNGDSFSYFIEYFLILKQFFQIH